MRTAAIVFFALALAFFVGVQLWESPAESGVATPPPPWEIAPGYSPQRLQWQDQVLRFGIYRPFEGSRHPAAVLLPAEKNPSPLARLRCQSAIEELVRGGMVVAVLEHHDAPPDARAASLAALVDQLRSADAVMPGDIALVGFGTGARLALAGAADDEGITKAAALVAHPTGAATAAQPRPSAVLCDGRGSETTEALAALPEAPTDDGSGFHASLDARDFWTEWEKILSFLLAATPEDTSATAALPGQYSLDQDDLALKVWVVQAKVRVDMRVDAENRLADESSKPGANRDQVMEALSEALETVLHQSFTGVAELAPSTSMELVFREDETFSMHSSAPGIPELSLHGHWYLDQNTILMRDGVVVVAKAQWFGDSVTVEHPTEDFSMVLRRR